MCTSKRDLKSLLSKKEALKLRPSGLTCFGYFGVTGLLMATKSICLMLQVKVKFPKQMLGELSVHLFDPKCVIMTLQLFQKTQIKLKPVYVVQSIKKLGLNIFHIHNDCKYVDNMSFRNFTPQPFTMLKKIDQRCSHIITACRVLQHFSGLFQVTLLCSLEDTTILDQMKKTFPSAVSPEEYSTFCKALYFKSPHQQSSFP